MTMRPDSIPSLDRLGDQLEAAAAASIARSRVLGRRRRAGLVLAPAFAVAAILAVLVLVVNGGSSTPPADAAVLVAAQKTVDASTGRFAFTLSAPAAGRGASTEVSDVAMSGAYDLKAGRVRTQVDLDALLRQVLAGAGAGGGGGLGRSFGSGEVIVDGETAYISAPSLTKQVGKDATWLKLDAAAVPGGQTVLAAGFSASPTDPVSFLELLKGLDGAPSVTGHDDAPGLGPTTHYQGVVSLEKAYDSLPPDERQKLEAAFTGIGGRRPDLPDVAFDVWVGNDGFVKRVSSTVDLSKVKVAGVAATSGHVTFTIDYTDIGAPVDITVPSGASVADLRDYLARMLEGVPGG